MLSSLSLFSFLGSSKSKPDPMVRDFMKQTMISQTSLADLSNLPKAETEKVNQLRELIQGQKKLIPNSQNQGYLLSGNRLS